MLKRITNSLCAFTIVALISSIVFINLNSGWQSVALLIQVGIVSSVIVIALTIVNFLNIRLNGNKGDFPVVLIFLFCAAVLFLLLVFIIISPTHLSS